MTTASAPAGSGAPVAISMHSPGPTPRAGTWPVKTRSTHVNVFGEPTAAPTVSAAITAYPSIAARSNGGTSPAARTSAATTRPCAAPIGTRSVRAIGIAASMTIRTASWYGRVWVRGRIG
jgi:hypothetical protein